MDIERIRLKTTLKCGRNVWNKGHIFDKKDGPFPGDINDQLRYEATLPESMRKIEALGTETVAPQKTDVQDNFDIAKAQLEIDRESLEKEQEAMLLEWEGVKKGKTAIDSERRELTELRKRLEDETDELAVATRTLKDKVTAFEHEVRDFDQIRSKFEKDEKKLHAAFQELDKDRLEFEDKKATWEPDTDKVEEVTTSEKKVVTFNEMVDTIVKANNGSWNAAAKAIGTTNTSLKNWYDGKSKPSADNLLKVERAYRIFGRLEDDSG